MFTGVKTHFHVKNVQGAEIKIILFILLLSAGVYSQTFTYEVKGEILTVNFDLRNTQYSEVSFKIWQNNDCVYGFTYYTGDIFSDIKRLKAGSYTIVLSAGDRIFKTEYIRIK